MELLLGNRHSSLDLGGGLLLAQDAERFGALATAVVGYRYQRYEGGLLVRIAFTPVWLEKGMIPWGGLMIGHAF